LLETADESPDYVRMTRRMLGKDVKKMKEAEQQRSYET
jgi:hypothetical protein